MTEPEVIGRGARTRGDTRGPVPIDWREAYQAEQRLITSSLLAEQRAGNDRWTEERTDGLYAPAPTSGLRSWSFGRIVLYALREAERRVNKSILMHAEAV